MSKITRIAYNSADWNHPTGEAKKFEAANTFNHLNGFGHEEWLFRSEWQINGWRYAFIQGVNKSRQKLIKECKPFDLTLFTMEPDKKRRYVAAIQDIECLNDQQARDALDEFKRRGWIDRMEQEIRGVGGNVAALGAANWAEHVLNVRFRLEKLKPFAPKAYAVAGDPVLRLTRYMLYDEANIGKSVKAQAKRSSAGSTMLPTASAFLRGAVAGVECTPEHARMQAKLMLELQAEYPSGQIMREKEFVDVSVQTHSELLLYEIKSDLEPRSVIRQALGQILEYAFHPSRQHTLPLKLVIVGRRVPSTDDKAYLCRLQKDFHLPLEYRVVSI